MRTMGDGGVMPRWQFLKGPVAPRQIVTDLSNSITAHSSQRIRCPHCSWQPRPESRWVCSSSAGPEPPFDGCGTHWNTFSTRGACPGCAHQWQWTMCLSCKAWSLHEDWYEVASDSGAG